MKQIFLITTLLLALSLHSSAQKVDIQAHRGGKGLYPENTIVAMLNALDWGVTTLELDLSISKDKKVIVSHEQVMDHHYVTKPDGTTFEKADEKQFKLYDMTYDYIKQFNTGLKGDPRFPQQKKVSTHKPLIVDLIDAVEAYVKANNLPLPLYNMEIKSSVKSGYAPEYKEFTDLVMADLLSKNIADRLTIQCFDTRTLNYMHEKYPQIKLAYLVGKNATDLNEALAKLNFIPDIYSPEFTLVDKQLVSAVHKKGMKILPWTPDEISDIQRMLTLKVDGLITNYPDRAIKLVHWKK